MDKNKRTQRYIFPKNAYTKQHGGVLRSVVGVFSAFLLGYIVSNAIDLNTMITWVSSQWAQAQVSGQENPQPKAVIAQSQEAPKPKFEFYTLLSKDNNTPSQVHQFASTAPQKTLAVGDKSSSVESVKSDEANDLLSNAPSVEEELATQSHAADVSEKNKSVIGLLDHPQAQETTVTATEPHSQASIQIERAKVAEQKKAAPVSSGPGAHETYMIQVAAVTRRPDAEHLKISLAAKGYSVMIISPDNKAGWFRVVVGPFHSRADAEQMQDKIGRNEHIQGMIRRVDV